MGGGGGQIRIGVWEKNKKLISVRDVYLELKNTLIEAIFAGAIFVNI